MEYGLISILNLISFVFFSRGVISFFVLSNETNTFNVFFNKYGRNGK